MREKYFYIWSLSACLSLSDRALIEITKQKNSSSIKLYITKYLNFVISRLMLAVCSPRIRIKPTKLTEDTRGDSQGRRTTSRRTMTVPEEDKPPPSRSNDLAAADGNTNNTVTPAEQSNGSPDSILSGPLDEGANSTSDTADSVVPTVPFPPISHSSSSFAMSESEPRNHKQSLSRANSGRRNAEGRIKDEQRAFGSPVSVDDDDDARF